MAPLSMRMPKPLGQSSLPSMLIPPPSPPPDGLERSPVSSPRAVTPYIPTTITEEQPEPVSPTIACCPFNIAYLSTHDSVKRCDSSVYVENDSNVARGRFSRVMRAIAAPPSPPQSPRALPRTSAREACVAAPRSVPSPGLRMVSAPPLPPPGAILAVKKAATGSKLEKIALEAEASVLSYVSSVTNAHERSEHVVDFYGFMPAQCALVLEFVPLTLEDYILAKSASLSTRTPSIPSTDPVVGHQTWLEIALSLTTGLHWLHEKAGVAHGDIKPSNILLKPMRERSIKQTITASSSSESPASETPEPAGPSDPFPYHAVYADFGSAHILTPPSSNGLPDSTNVPPSPTSPASLASSSSSVGTPAFTAPELLSLRSPTTCPTTPADVFSLAATLLAAVTGDVHIYEVSSTVALYHMAQNGHLIIDNVRNMHPMRLLPRSMVVRLLKGAVVRDPLARWGADEWAALVRGELGR